MHWHNMGIFHGRASAVARLLVRSGASGASAWLGVVLATTVLFVTAMARGESPFAALVVEYSPAPGQFVNDAVFNDPTAALGPPSGGGTAAPNNESVVTLGGFGGALVLSFDHRVLDDPRNPWGMDAIVFGNAYWVGGNVQRHWAECVTIEIGMDTNENGLADDLWYLIPGSHIDDPRQQLTSQVWDDDANDDRYPPADMDWIPDGFAGQWTTEAFQLPTAEFGAVVVVNPSSHPEVEGIFGYGDYSPTLVLGDLDADEIVDDPLLSEDDFYTWPDDPQIVGISPGSGGGDAFDIRWAVDRTTGQPANLLGFDFIRLTTAVSAVSPNFGEKSGEIDAVADVRPDPFGDSDEDDDIDLRDVAALQSCFMDAAATPACDGVDLGADGVISDADAMTVLSRITGPKR